MLSRLSALVGFSEIFGLVGGISVRDLLNFALLLDLDLDFCLLGDFFDLLLFFGFFDF